MNHSTTHPHPPREAAGELPPQLELPAGDSQVAESADEPTALDLEGVANLPRDVEAEADAATEPRAAPSAHRVSSAPHAERNGTDSAEPRRRRRSADFYHRPHDKDLPIDGYTLMTVPEIIDRIERMSLDEMRAVQRYEGSHRRRKTLLVKLERLTRAMAAVPAR